MVPNAVEGLGTKVEVQERNVRAPECVIKATFDEGIECLLARVPSGTVTTVVTKRDGFGERHVKA